MNFWQFADMHPIQVFILACFGLAALNFITNGSIPSIIQINIGTRREE